MNIYKNIIEKSKNNESCSRDIQDHLREKEKEKWIQQYASRILKIWHQRQAPLGATFDYIIQIKAQLVHFYDDPLKKMFIELSY